ncbi:tRNA (guanine-N(1)-)-methyltransferase [Cellulomonas persica]
MRIDVLTIFPDYLAPLGLSLVGKAREAGILDLHVHDLRNWTTDRHRTVDDTPFGGGAGMVMRADVWGTALDEILTPDAHLLLPTPSGQVFAQPTAHALAAETHLVVACGRYEGIDARVAEHYRAAGVRVSELSLGDYVLNGGEVAALVVVEAVARLLPGVVGNPESLVEESHGEAGLLEVPRVHQTADMARARRAGRAALGSPRAHRAVAARRGAAAHRGAPPGHARGARPGCARRARPRGPRRTT